MKKCECIWARRALEPRGANPLPRYGLGAGVLAGPFGAALGSREGAAITLARYGPGEGGRKLGWRRGWRIRGRPSANTPCLEPENDAQAHHGHRQGPAEQCNGKL